jgi:phage terminase small subunit
MSQRLTPRERRFVAEYARLRNAKQAPLNAGYSPRCAQMLGSRVLHKPHIVAALAAAGVEVPRGPHPSTQIRKPASRLRHGLTWRQHRFVQEYLICGNATEAARRIGLGEKNAQANGARLLKRRFVAEAIQAEQEASARRTHISADRVRTEFARIAFADMGAIADWDGDTLTLRPRDEIAPDDRAAIAELRLKPGKHGTRATIRLHSKQAALDALAKLLGLYVRPMETEESKAARGQAAREELRKRLLRIARGGDEAVTPDPANESGEAKKKAKG